VIQNQQNDSTCHMHFPCRDTNWTALVVASTNKSKQMNHNDPIFTIDISIRSVKRLIISLESPKPKPHSDPHFAVSVRDKTVWDESVIHIQQNM
jgi:hypothetical protein